MEHEHTCKSLTAVYHEDKFAFGSSHKVEFNITRSAVIKVSIEQCITRTITIAAEEELPVGDLYSVFSRLERLLMMFDGRFYTLESLNFADSLSTSESRLSNHAKHLMNRRLTCFESSDFCKYSQNKIIDYRTILSTSIYEIWEGILDDLDTRHQMFLYSICDNGLPTDVNLAFLIEQTEPLVEIVKSQKYIFASLEPGERGTSLKMCLDVLITKYGTDIFKNELTDEYDSFLQKLVNSRNRIMHIKCKQNKRYIEKKVDIILYSIKLYLLYRCVIFDLLGIDSRVYQDQLNKCVDTWDQWAERNRLST